MSTLNQESTAYALGMSNAGFDGATAHAKPRIPAPVVATETSWGYCHQIKFGATPKNSHFQRWKVAP